MEHKEIFRIPMYDKDGYLVLINLICVKCAEEFHRTPYEYNKIVGTYLNCDWCDKPTLIY